jgi:hypothetical protein
MADLQHSTLTDPDIHEPKGASTAVAGQVYEANGAGSGAWVSKFQNNAVIVNSMSDFPAPSGGVITLAADTLYILGAPVSTGDRFVVGNNSAITAFNNLPLTLTYTGSLDMFTGVDVSFQIYEIGISAPSATEIFDFTDTLVGSARPTIFEASLIIIDDCNKLGTFTNQNLVDMLDVKCFDCTDGVTFSGTRTKEIILDKLALESTGASFIGVDLGVSTHDVCEIINCEFIDSTAGSIAISGTTASGNITANHIGVIENNELDTNIKLSGITIDDFRWFFLANNTVGDTLPAGLLSMNGNGTATVISGLDTPALIAGTWAVESTSHFTGTAAGRLTYDGERPIRVDIDMVGSADPASGTNKDVTFKLAKNGTAIANSGQIINIDSGTPKLLSMHWRVDLVQGDYLEVFIELLSSGTAAVNTTVPTATFRIN